MPIHKELSERPSSGAVAHVAAADDAAELEASVERNVKWWSMLEAVREGRLPSNVQLDAGLAYLSGRCTLPPSVSSSLSGDTLKVFSYARALIGTVRQVVRQKNGDELLQDTISLAYVESRSRPGSPRSEKDGGGTPVDAEVARSPPRRRSQDDTEEVDSDDEEMEDPGEVGGDDLDGQVDGTAREFDGGHEGEIAQGARHIRTLAMILVTTPEVREVVTQLVAIGRDMVSKADRDARGTTEGEGAEADGEEEDAVEADEVEADLAEDGVEAVGTKADTGVTASCPQAQVPKSRSPAPSSRRTSVSEDGERFYDAESELPPFDTHPAFRLPGNLSNDGGSHWDIDDDDYDESGSEGEESGGGENGGSSGDPRFSLPAERLDHFVRHFKTAVTSLQSKEGYAEAMAWLLDAFEAYESEVVGRALPDFPGRTRGRMQGATRRILANIVTLLERFARGRPLSRVQRSIVKLYALVLDDPEMVRAWAAVDAYLRRILLEPGYVTTDACAAHGRELWDQANEWLKNELYRAQWNAVCAGASSWLGFGKTPPPPNAAPDVAATWFADDPLTRRLEGDWSRLTASLLLDSRGKIVFKQHMWTELVGLLFPALRGFGYVPFPRIESLTPNIEWVLENVYVSVANLLPTFTTVAAEDVVKLSPFEETREACAKGTYTRVKVALSQIQADVRNALAAVHWKKGIEIKDSGIVDIALSRQGLCLDLDLEVDTHPNSPHILRARKINASMDELTITARHTHHDGLYRILLPTLLSPFLKRRMSLNLEQNLTKGIKRADAELLELRTRLQRVNADAEQKRRDGDPLPGPGTRVLQVLYERAQESKRSKKPPKPRPICA